MDRAFLAHLALHAALSGGLAVLGAAKRVDSPQLPVAFALTNTDLTEQESELRGMLEVVARLDRDG